jgi:hypothetical protein
LLLNSEFAQDFGTENRSYESLDTPAPFQTPVSLEFSPSLLTDIQMETQIEEFPAFEKGPGSSDSQSVFDNQMADRDEARQWRREVRTTSFIPFCRSTAS